MGKWTKADQPASHEADAPQPEQAAMQPEPAKTEPTTNPVATGVKSESPALDEKRKTALLRYMGILFCVAFLLVLLSSLIQMRNSRLTISELNQASNNALQNAEALQTMNRDLIEQNTALLEENANLEQQLRDTEQTLTQRKRQLDELGGQLERIESEHQQQLTAYEKQLEAHEALAAALLAQDSGNAETYKAAMQSLLELSKYLTPNDKLLYQSLLAENE